MNKKVFFGVFGLGLLLEVLFPIWHWYRNILPPRLEYDKRGFLFNDSAFGSGFDMMFRELNIDNLLSEIILIGLLSAGISVIYKKYTEYKANKNFGN